MANVFEYTLSLNDKVSDKLTKIGTAIDKQLAAWTTMQQKIVDSEKTITECGISIGNLKERINSLKAERELISTDNIDTIKRINNEINSLEKEIQRLEKIDAGNITNWVKGLKSAIPDVILLTNPLNTLTNIIYNTGTYLNASLGAWSRQTEAEARLTASMRLYIDASDEEINNIKRLISVQQSLGVVNDQVQLSGTQQLATFIKNKESLETLILAMNNLLVQQKGLNATEQDAIQIGSIMGEAMQGQISALTDIGISLNSAQKNILKYGNEEQRAATLAQAITDNVGSLNQALASTPEGGLKRHANTMLDLQERIGGIYSSIIVSLLPVFDIISSSLDDITLWFDQNEEIIKKVINTITELAQAAFSLIGDAIDGAIGFFDKWISKLQDGDVVVTTISVALGALATSITIIRTAKAAWAAIQNILNITMLACPLTWFIAMGIALIGVITYLCYKIDGWGSLWDGVVGFMKFSFLAFVEKAKQEFLTVSDFILTGIDNIKLKWYEFKEALGLGDSSENQAAIAQINDDIEERKKAIADGAKKIEEYTTKAQESLSGINMSWNSEKSLSDVTDGLKEKLGMGGASSAPGTDGNAVITDDTVIPKLEETDTNQQTKPKKVTNWAHSTGAGTDTSSAISTGGSRSSSVTINLKSLVETLSFGSYEGDRDTMQRDLESRLIRVLEMANSAM